MALTGWHILVILAVCMQLFLACSAHNYNVFFTALQLEFGKSALITSWIGALGSSFVCMGTPLTAIIGNKIGCFRLLLLGIFLHCAGYLAFSFSPTVAYCFLTYSIAGWGSSCMLSASGNFLLEWFSKRKSLCAATSAAAMGASLGILVQGPSLTLLSAAHGWRNCFRVLSGFCLVFGVLAGLPFSLSPKHRQLRESADKKSPSDEQEQCSLDEEIATTNRATEEDVELKTFKDDDIDSAETKEVGPSNANNGSVLLNSEAWLWVTSITLSQFGWSFITINYSSYVYSLGLATDRKPVALAIIGAAELGGKILFAVFGDHLPCLKLYAIAASSIIAAVVSAFLTLCSSFAHLIVLSLAWGILRGVNYGACLSAADELFGSLGTYSVTSLAMFGYGFGSIIGASVTGALYDLTGNYVLSLVVLAVIFFISALSMVIIPMKRRFQTKGFTSVKSDAYRYQTANSREQSETEAVAV